MNTTFKAISAPLIALIIIITFFAGRLLLMEGYYPIDPLIDTFQSQNFTIKKFDSVKIGDTEWSVIDMLGNPLYTSYDSTTNLTTYSFTSDGKLLKKANDQAKREYLDFAWYRSSVELDTNRRVVSIDKGWSYD
jgi:hypothetical protein